MSHNLRFEFGLLAVALMFASTTFAKADTMSCRSQAEAAANEWANGSIRPVGPAEMGGPGEVTVISYGKKFVVPRRNVGDQVVVSGGLGALAKQRTEVYYEELARCQNRGRTNIWIYSRRLLAD